MVPPRSDKISRVPPYSRTKALSTRTGLSPTMARLSRRFRFLRPGHWPGPRSLATTNGVSVDVLSSGYLDVSVRRVCFLHLWIQCRMTHKGSGFPIRKSADQCLLATPHGLSQRATSFIASQCQGIHQTPFSYLILKPPCTENNPIRVDLCIWQIPQRYVLPNPDIFQDCSAVCIDSGTENVRS